MRELYVIDTSAIISFFDSIFRYSDNYNNTSLLSKNIKRIINEAIVSKETDIRLSIPTIVFIEIYEKWLTSEEFCRKFFYEVFTLLRQSKNIEIKPLDREVLENLLKIGGNLKNHDIHDKLILASAMSLEAPLITLDTKIIDYIKRNNVIPSVYN